MTDWKIFTGNSDPHDGLDRLPDPPSWRVFQDEAARQTRKGATFQARPEEIDLVNAALYLRRPLLVEGKPGTGKTSLAYAVAHELKLGEVLYWPITTRTILKDGLYTYDAIGRLQDSQQQGHDNLQDIGKYIRLGPLGTALLPADNPKRPRILLIDEIDKSDIDLPNDLLHVFEEGRFRIPELVRIKDAIETVTVGTAYEQQDSRIAIRGGQVQCKRFPLVVLTSNGERDFPPAFLRRCLRLQMRDPNAEDLARIVAAHLGAEALAEATPLIDAFLSQRDNAGEDVATDQLLSAIYLLLQKDVPTDEARQSLLKKILKPLSGMGAR